MAKANSTKTKTAPEAAQSVAPPTAAPVATATAGTETQGPLRENPRINEKIDEWIKRNPDQFKFFNEMPHDRAVRKLILNEIDKYERQQKARSYREQEQQQGERGPRQERRQEYRQGNGQGHGQGGGRRY
jgi:hypothetical protein